MDEFPFYGALLVIFFIAWVLRRIQEWFRSKINSGGEARQDPGDWLPDSQQPNDVEDEFRKLFEALGTDVVRPPKPVERELPPERPKPPPPRKPAVTASAKPPALSASEQRALDAIKAGEVRPYRRPSEKRRSLHGVSMSNIGLRALLQSNNGLRNAVLLKEVLDEPRALRPEVRGDNLSGPA